MSFQFVKKKILFVGQTPPPYGGQAVMIEKILRGHYHDIQLVHVRMSFSKEMDQIGKTSFYKIVHLLQVTAKIYYHRLFSGTRVLYYPPAGPDKIPVLRDIFILILTRWLFKNTIFHFHAGGVSSLNINSKLFLFLYKKAYFHADCAILLSSLNPPDAVKLHAKKEFIVPYGIEDNFFLIPPRSVENATAKILFVSIIKESKGILVLLEACLKLKSRGVRFMLAVMGKFESNEFEHRVKRYIDKAGLEADVSFLGVLSGNKKFETFRDADIFCFPTFFESETFGVVLLEAMQFSLPIVSTFWRGIPSVVRDNENGFLANIRNSEEVADKLQMLILDPLLRKRMGVSGRRLFLEHYTIKIFHNNMERVFQTC